MQWDQPLRDILGSEFRLQDNFRTEKATIRDLLAHRLGMPSYWGVTTGAMNISRTDLCMKKLRYFPVDNEFRSRFEYSNYPFVLAGYVTERLRGKTWEDDVTGTLFKPLGMSDTRVSSHLRPVDWENIAYSYCLEHGQLIRNPEQDQLIFISKICPAGCIFSTATDMAKWMKFHLSGGKDETGKQVMQTRALDKLYEPISAVPREDIGPPIFPVDDTRSTYGLGFYNGQYRGFRKVYHTGSYSSYNCRMSLLPGVSIGVWACVNSPGDQRGILSAKLINQFALDMLLDVDPWLNVSTGCSFPAPWVISSQGRDRQEYTTATHQRPSLQYVGVYEHLAFGNFTVYLRNDSLRYEFGLLLHGRLNPSETLDKFFMTLDQPLTYRLNGYPEYPHGFPVYFTNSDGSGSDVDAVAVPYFESRLPPVFKKASGYPNGGLMKYNDSLLILLMVTLSTAVMQ